jgi:hypothetical protein
MKGERNRRATRSLVSIICGIVFGVIVAWQLLSVLFGIVFAIDHYTSQQLTEKLLPVLFPAGMLVYGLMEGLRANLELRRSSGEGENPPGISLVFAAALLVALFLLVLLVVRTQMDCTARPLECEIL